MLTIEGFVIDPPGDFKTEEMTVGLRQQQAHSGSSASLIVQSKKARLGATVDELASEALTELAQTLGKMNNLARTALTFADGGTGAMLSFDWTTASGPMRQYFVFRVNGDRLCTVTLTVPREDVTPESAMPLMKAIASIRPA